MMCVDLKIGIILNYILNDNYMSICLYNMKNPVNYFKI